jgi:hypothetical protein
LLIFFIQAVHFFDDEQEKQRRSTQQVAVDFPFEEDVVEWPFEFFVEVDVAVAA